jgi:hypothetical protein
VNSGKGIVYTGVIVKATTWLVTLSLFLQGHCNLLYVSEYIFCFQIRTAAQQTMACHKLPVTNDLVSLYSELAKLKFHAGQPPGKMFVQDNCGLAAMVALGLGRGICIDYIIYLSAKPSLTFILVCFVKLWTYLVMAEEVLKQLEEQLNCSICLDT